MGFKGIKVLEDLFLHFDAINSVNIGMDFKAKFGDPNINSNAACFKESKFSNFRSRHVCLDELLVFNTNVLGLNTMDLSNSMLLDPSAMNYFSKSEYHEVVSGCDIQEQLYDKDFELLFSLMAESVKPVEVVISLMFLFY